MWKSFSRDTRNWMNHQREIKHWDRQRLINEIIDHYHWDYSDYVDDIKNVKGDMDYDEMKVREALGWL